MLQYHSFWPFHAPSYPSRPSSQCIRLITHSVERNLRAEPTIFSLQEYLLRKRTSSERLPPQTQTVMISRFCRRLEPYFHFSLDFAFFFYIGQKSANGPLPSAHQKGVRLLFLRPYLSSGYPWLYERSETIPKILQLLLIRNWIY